MIKDHINNAHQYDDLHPNFRSVLEILQSLNLDALQPGHIELDGNYVYININETKSKNKEEKGRNKGHNRKPNGPREKRNETAPTGNQSKNNTNEKAQTNP